MIQMLKNQYSFFHLPNIYLHQLYIHYFLYLWKLDNFYIYFQPFILKKYNLAIIYT
jgi:hypothetical protein